MKTQEILLASALLALVAGAGAALATRALVDGSPRTEAPARAVESAPAADASAETQRVLEDLRVANAQLQARLATLEARVGEVQSGRTAVAPESTRVELATSEVLAPETRSLAALAGPELSPQFVDSVGQAMEKIRDKEEAEREKKRKELQAQRVEERVTRLQRDLGLNNRQSGDLRTAFLTQDEKREQLFQGMRDGQGDPRDMKETFRTLRDETLTTIQGILTPEQYTAFQKTEEDEFGRRGFGGDFGGRDGGPGARPPEEYGRRGR
jgi:hypothetical protein